MRRSRVVGTLLSVLAAAAWSCSNSSPSQRHGVIEDVDGCELGRIGRGWMSVDWGDTVFVASGRMRYAMLSVHRAESAETLAADVMAGRLPQYADDSVLPRAHAANIEIGGTEYPAWWVGTPNVMAHVFVPSKEKGYVFVVRVDLPRILEEKTEDWKMQRVGRLLRPLVRSLANSPVDSFGKCLLDA